MKNVATSISKEVYCKFVIVTQLQRVLLLSSEIAEVTGFQILYFTKPARDMPLDISAALIDNAVKLLSESL